MAYLFCGFYIGNESSRSRLSKWLLFLPGAFTFGLGTWQILRRQDKVIPIHSLSLYFSLSKFVDPDPDILASILLVLDYLMDSSDRWGCVSVV